MIRIKKSINLYSHRLDCINFKLYEFISLFCNKSVSSDELKLLNAIESICFRPLYERSSLLRVLNG